MDCAIASNAARNLSSTTQSYGGTIAFDLQLREEISAAKKALEDMDSVTEEDAGEAAKYDLLVKRDMEMTAFIEGFDATRAGILAEQQTAQDTIVLLLEDISKGLEDGAAMPSVEAHAEMEEAKVSPFFPAFARRVLFFVVRCILVAIYF